MTDSYPVQLLIKRRDKYAQLAEEAEDNNLAAAAADYMQISIAAQDAIDKISEAEAMREQQK
jgi:hypothetical protein